MSNACPPRLAPCNINTSRSIRTSQLTIGHKMCMRTSRQHDTLLQNSIFCVRTYKRDRPALQKTQNLLCSNSWNHAWYFTLRYSIAFFQIKRIIITKQLQGKKRLHDKINQVSKLVLMSGSVLGMRLRHIAATSTWIVRLPLLSHPPATRSSPLGISVHAHSERAVGNSPTCFQLFVAGW